MRNWVSPAAVVLAAIALGLAGCNTPVNTAYALTSTGQIIQFSTGSTSTGTGAVANTATVNGLPGGQSLVQLAYRPSTGVLYGVTTANELCTVDPNSGIATLVSTSQFVPDTLTNVAIAFDPVNDQLRITANSSASPTGFENLRVNPGDGSLAHLTTLLGYVDSTAGNPQIAGLAYTDEVSGATSTTLYGLDVASQKLVRIGNPDISQTSDADAGGVQPIGTPGVQFSASLGFAIARDGLAYAALAPTGSGAGLYAIDLDTGAATFLGTPGTNAYSLISLVIAP